METTLLKNVLSGVNQKCHLMVNDRDTSAVVESEMIRPWVECQSALDNHLLFATSGSSGRRKWVALSRDALLASARVVNTHLGVTSADRWLLALPTFHVGGMGVFARCHIASCEVVVRQEKWDASSYVSVIDENGVTLSSLVPTQLVDIVRCGLKAPPSLRAVLIGGGRLDTLIYQQAVDLGWPVVETYGMTEACSQVATAKVGSRELHLLPSWQTKTDNTGRLSLKGECLLTGYVVCENGNVSMRDPKRNGWFLTGDVAEVQDACLNVQGRVDRCVKVLGELVSLDEVEQEWGRISLLMGFPVSEVVAVAVSDERKGNRLILCVEGVEVFHLEEFNVRCNPLHRVDEVQIFKTFPRSALGKILYRELATIVSTS